MTTPATCSAARPFDGSTVTTWWPRFCAAGEAHGWPAATLTDNGAVYTSRFTGGRNSFEHLLAYLGIRQKNGAPGHPQTQGKIERFHQTLKRWLGSSPRRGPSPSCRRSSMPSASPTTRNGHTGRSGGSHPAKPTGRDRRHTRPGAGLRATSGCATTSPTGRARSPCAGPAVCTTWRSAPPTPVGVSSPSSTSPRSPSWLSTRARCCRPTTSSPDRRYWRNLRRDPGRWPGSRATE